MKVLLLLTLLSSFSFGQHLQKPCPTETWDATTGKCVARPPRVDPGTLVYDLCGWGDYNEGSCMLEYYDIYNTGLPTEYNLTEHIKEVTYPDAAAECMKWKGEKWEWDCLWTYFYLDFPKNYFTVESPVVPPLSDDEIRELRTLINDWNRLNF